MVNHSEKYCNVFLNTTLRFMNTFLGHRKDLTPRALKSEKEFMPICRCKILSRTRRKNPTTPHDRLPMFKGHDDIGSHASPWVRTMGGWGTFPKCKGRTWLRDFVLGPLFWEWPHS